MNKDIGYERAASEKPRSQVPKVVKQIETLDYRVSKYEVFKLRNWGPVLTPDFGKSDVMELWKQSAVYVNVKADDQRLLSKKLAGAYMQVYEVKAGS